MNSRLAALPVLWAALGCLPSEDLSDYSAGWASVSSTGGTGLTPSPSQNAGSSNETAGAASDPGPELAAPDAGSSGGGDGVVGSGTLPLAGSGGTSTGVSPVDQTGGAAGAPGVAGAAGTTSVSESEPCPDGVLGPGESSCYLVSAAPAAWQNARIECEAWAGALVKVETTEEDAFLDGLTATAIWLGGSDTVFDNIFVWTDGSPITFGNWGFQQPNRFPGPDCVEKRDATSGRLWFDQPCDNLREYVCEKPANAGVAP